jgi:hypothetical protein
VYSIKLQPADCPGCCLPVYPLLVLQNMLQGDVATPASRTTRIFVARIPQSVTDTQFRAYFEKYGKLQDAYMPRDHSRQMYRGIGFVTFASPESVEKVMACKHWCVRARSLRGVSKLMGAWLLQIVQPQQQFGSGSARWHHYIAAVRPFPAVRLGQLCVHSPRSKHELVHKDGC